MKQQEDRNGHRGAVRAGAVVVAAVAVVLLGGCASEPLGPGPGAQGTGLAAQQLRIEDQTILRDRNALSGVQGRLRKLNEAGVEQGSYALAKAQCWLDSAKSQYEENDRTGYVEEALAQAQQIAAQLEADRSAKAGWDTPLVAKSERLREDLWERMGRVKASAQLSCAAQALACAEVRLVRAGHASQQTGWRAAVPHIGMVEDGLRRAQQQVQACEQQQEQQAALRARQAPPPAPPAPAPAPVVVAAAPAPQVIRQERFELLTDALFAFDRAALGDLQAAGEQRLKEVVARLKGWGSIERLVITGHTDRLGSEAYNERLSQQRAQAVKDYLGAQGINAKEVQVIGRGKADASTTSCTAKMSLPELRACLQNDRRVSIEASGSGPRK